MTQLASGLNLTSQRLSESTCVILNPIRDKNWYTVQCVAEAKSATSISRMFNSAAETVPSCRLHGNLPVVHRAQSNQTHQRRRAHCTASQSTNQSHDSRTTSTNHLKLAASLLTAQQFACLGSANASEAVSSLAEASATLPLALGGGAAIAALSAALIATDPQKRCDVLESPTLAV